MVHCACLIRSIHYCPFGCAYVTHYLALLPDKMKTLSTESALFPHFTFQRIAPWFLATFLFFLSLSFHIQSEKLPATNSQIMLSTLLSCGCIKLCFYISVGFKSLTAGDLKGRHLWKCESQQLRAIALQSCDLRWIKPWRKTIRKHGHCEKNHKSVMSLI